MSYNYYQFIEKLGLLETTLSKTLYELYLDCLIEKAEYENKI